MTEENDLYQRALYEIKLEDNFYEFVKEAWEYVDSTPFIDAWHTQVLCMHLQAVADQKLDRLIINIPPGFGKSIICSVLYPIWLWIRDPTHQFLTGSHSYVFALRDTRKSRDLINSDWFQYFWGKKIKLCSDQNQKGMYQNTEGGYRTAFGTGSNFTGWRAHTILFDDPNNIGDVYSKAEREKRSRIVSEGLENRLHLVGFTSMIIIMQRLHIEDVTGHLLDTQTGWTHLYLPLEGEPIRKCKTPFFTDNRKKGELLWSQFGKKKLKRAKKTATYNSQYQQRPTLDSGHIFLTDLLRYYKELPVFIRIVQSWDTAYKEGKTNDYSACTTWGVTATGYYLIHAWRGRVHYLELKRRFIELHDKFKPNKVLIEDKASGQSLIQEVKKTTNICHEAIKTPAKMTKEERASTVTPAFEAERVWFPDRAQWLADFKEEVTSFPMVKHDDWVDTMVQFLRHEMGTAKNPRIRTL